jgi:hypothetical protein
LRARELENGRRELQRAGFRCFGSRLELQEYGGDVDAPMRRRIGPEPPARFLELAFAADSVPTPGLVPGHGNVHQPLEEVPLGLLSGAPGVFQLLMSGEELASSNKFQAALERISQRHPGLPGAAV